MKRILVVLLAVGCLLVVGCGKKEDNNNMNKNDKWPDSDAVTYVPVFIAGTYVSGECGNTDCEIEFKSVELASFEKYAATLITRGFVVNGGRKTDGKKEIYEASNEDFVYVKAVYNTENSTLNISSSIKNKK
jgi:hypothetical protein